MLCADERATGQQLFPIWPSASGLRSRPQCDDLMQIALLPPQQLSGSIFCSFAEVELKSHMVAVQLAYLDDDGRGLGPQHRLFEFMH